MFSAVVVIDHDHAKLYRLTPEGIATEKLERRRVMHSNPADEEKHKNATSLYQEVATRLRSAGEILILGHGVSKTQFKHHLEEHNQDIAKKVVGLESINKVTDNEILALARKFFKAAHLFK